MIHAQNVKDEVMLAPQAVTAGATATANLDTLDHDCAVVRVAFGAISTDGESPIVLKLAESDDTVATNFSDITACVGGGVGGFTIPARASLQNKIVRFQLDLRQRKRYVRLTLSPETNDTNDNVTVSAIGQLSRSRELPAGTSDLGDTAVVVTG